MNVNQINELLAKGEIDREDMWPRLVAYESKATPFLFEFGLNDLPLEPGIITVRGPRQYGKSTWLDLELRYTIQDHGKGTAYYANGDALRDAEELYQTLVRLEHSFSPKAKVRRIFIDEVTSVINWERAVKRAFDEGLLRKTLLVTTGSKAMDLRRGSERLPGRKGRLPRTDYTFLPISYNQFYKTCGKLLEEKTWIAYLLAGGAPLALNDISQFEQIPEYFIELIRDWIHGELVASRRSRLHLHSLLNVLFRFGGQPVGFAKLAREAGLSNNTVASGFIEQLSDLLSVLPQWQWDQDRQRPIFRKPCKFPFVNLAVATSFYSANMRHIHEFEHLAERERAMLLEWLVAQEIWRRSAYRGKTNPESLGFWKSETHEIDFVTPEGEFIEVKLGKAGPLEFSWFPKSFPNKHLTVICTTPFETDYVRGITLHDFLMNDGLPERISA